MLTIQALMCFVGNNDRNGWTIWSCATSPWKDRTRPKSKPQHIIPLNCGGVHTYANCVILDSSDHQKALKMLLLSDELWLILWLNHYLFLFCCKPSNWELYFIYICKIYYYIYFTWGKNLWHQQKGSTNRRLGRTK